MMTMAKCRQQSAYEVSDCAGCTLCYAVRLTKRGKKTKHAPSTCGTTFRENTTTLDPDSNARLSSHPWELQSCYDNVAFDPNNALHTATRRCLHRHSLRICSTIVAMSHRRLRSASTTRSESATLDQHASQGPLFAPPPSPSKASLPDNQRRNTASQLR